MPEPLSVLAARQFEVATAFTAQVAVQWRQLVVTGILVQQAVMTDHVDELHVELNSFIAAAAFLASGKWQ
jgi:hypothetical protein